MDAKQAAIEIAEIQSRLSNAQTFRGYRSLTVSLTGILALVGAVVQPLIIPEPARTPFLWLAMWLTVAAICGAGVGIELLLRCRRCRSPWFVRLTVSAVGRFLPCVAAGAALTVTLATVAPQSLWMLPGLWAILFGLGVFASSAVLPRGIAGVGTFYLAAGIGCLVLARDQAALSPEAMGVPFGFGQLLTAAILYWRLEHGDDGSHRDI